MTTLRAIIALIALGAAGGAAWWVNSVLAERDTLREDVATQARSIAALELSRDQAITAKQVARAEAERVARKAAEYDRLKEILLRGEDDAPLPDWFRRYLDDLFGRVQP